MTDVTQIGVVGSGAWGTALAIVANRAGCKTTLWSRNPNVIQSIEEKRSNDAYLPEVFLDPQIAVTESLADVCKQDIILLAIPAQFLRAVLIAMSDLLSMRVPLVVCTKGVERGSLSLMSEVVEGILPKNPVAVLSGPNFAREVAAGQPTATTLACEKQDVAERIAEAIGGKYFRPYLTDDVIGVQVAGAVKNVIAIACGIAKGKGLGENARAALITRGMAEIRRLNHAKGGRGETLLGLSGIGDLVLTCSSELSRNYSLGVRIGEAGSVKEAALEAKGITEGVATSESVTQLAGKLNISMPICLAIHHILQGQVDVKDAIGSLLSRPLATEVLETSI